jgi:copper(I)-binding protein
MKNTLLSRPAAALFSLRWMLTAVLGASACSGVLAQAVTVNNAWARATVPGQKAAGVFMTLNSPVGSRLMSAASPVAAFGQVHEMRMEGDVMKMRALKDGLEIPAGKSVELKPGSYHVMLMDLKAPLMKDTTIPVTLVFVDAKGVESKTELTVPVNAMGQMPMALSAH